MTGVHQVTVQPASGVLRRGENVPCAAGLLSCLGYDRAFRIRRLSVRISGCVIYQFQKRLEVGGFGVDWVVLVTMGDSPQLELLCM